MFVSLLCCGWENYLNKRTNFKINKSVRKNQNTVSQYLHNTGILEKNNCTVITFGGNCKLGQTVNLRKVWDKLPFLLLVGWLIVFFCLVGFDFGFVFLGC